MIISSYRQLTDEGHYVIVVPGDDPRLISAQGRYAIGHALLDLLAEEAGRWLTSTSERLQESLEGELEEREEIDAKMKELESQRDTLESALEMAEVTEDLQESAMSSLRDRLADLERRWSDSSRSIKSLQKEVVLWTYCDQLMWRSADLKWNSSAKGVSMVQAVPAEVRGAFSRRDADLTVAEFLFGMVLNHPVFDGIRIEEVKHYGVGA